MSLLIGGGKTLGTEGAVRDHCPVFVKKAEICTESRTRRVDSYREKSIINRIL